MLEHIVEHQNNNGGSWIPCVPSSYDDTVYGSLVINIRH
jgi:hypothetical protein